METISPVESFSALAHPHRLAVFRLLMRAGPAGMNAGDIASELELAPSSLSFHTRWLAQAGLIEARRDGRHVVYRVNVEGTRALIRYLTEDCCAGHPDLCGFSDLAGAGESCAAPSARRLA